MTIDGLEALRRLVASPASTAPPRFEINGGWFDGPEDLRTLGDYELERIVVKTDQVEVILEPGLAIAIGDPEMCAKIRREWTPRLRTRRRPKPVGPLDVIPGVLALVIGIFFAFITAFVLIPQSGWWRGLLAGVAAIAFCGGIGVLALRARPESYALVKPVTLEELRKERAIEQRHWQVAAIALAAVTVTLLGILVTVLVRK